MFVRAQSEQLLVSMTQSCTVQHCGGQDTAKKASFPRVAKVCQMNSGKLAFCGNQYVTHVLLTPAM